MELRKEVAEFAETMEAELRENDHKGGWLEMSTGALMERLVEETDELRDALHEGATLDDIMAEAADVANFAMMIADVCKHRLAQRWADSKEVR